MTSRQARTQRREAERKAAKLARKAEKALSAKIGFVSQNAPPPVKAPAPLSDLNAERRRETNRANAQYSTGPRTQSGKLASSRNSLKHGLASGELIIPGEDRAAFDALLNHLLEEHRPANATEELLVNEIAQAYWLAQRAIRLQNACFTDEGVDDNRLSLFLRYQTTHDRRFHKALNALMKLKKHHAARFVSENNGFARQDTRFVPQNSAAATTLPEFVPQNALSLRPENGFVSQGGAST